MRVEAERDDVTAEPRQGRDSDVKPSAPGRAQATERGEAVHLQVVHVICIYMYIHNVPVQDLVYLSRL